MNEVLIHDNNLDEPWTHYAKLKQTVTEVQYYMIPFILKSRIGKSTETKSRFVVKSGNREMMGIFLEVRMEMF